MRRNRTLGGQSRKKPSGVMPGRLFRFRMGVTVVSEGVPAKWRLKEAAN
jgi:hypothetical protein